MGDVSWKTKADCVTCNGDQLLTILWVADRISEITIKTIFLLVIKEETINNNRHVYDFLIMNLLPSNKIKLWFDFLLTMIF